MKNAIKISEPPAPPDEPALAPIEPQYILNIVGVYQDSVTRDWAAQSFRRATKLAGEECIQNSWYDAGSLGDPGTFLEAVSAALIADVIVISIYAMDELPLDLYVWFDAWLPRRLSRVGALAAVVGVAEPMEPQSLRTFDYLHAVARKAQLDFIPHERQRPVASLPASSNQTAGHGLSARFLPELPGSPDEGYNHCGLHE